MKYVIGQVSTLQDGSVQGLDIEVFDDVIYISQMDRWLHHVDAPEEHENIISLDNDQFLQLFEIFKRIKESRETV